MFFSDDVLSRVAGYDCGGTPRYQSAKVSVWATFTNEEAAVNITADVTRFVHEVSAKDKYIHYLCLICCIFKTLVHF